LNDRSLVQKVANLHGSGVTGLCNAEIHLRKKEKVARLTALPELGRNIISFINQITVIVFKVRPLSYF